MSAVSLSALRENLDDSLEIYADVVLEPAFPQNELERLRKATLAQIAQEKTQPVAIALRVFPRLVYGEDHAYSLPLTGSGPEESVRKLSREDLVAHHRTRFKPNDAEMVVVGDTTMDEIKPKLEKAFGRWQPGATPEKNIPDVGHQGGERVYVIDRPEAEQSIILAGNVAPPFGTGNEIAREAMNEIIGGSPTSRIYSNLRTDKHWSYGAYSFLLSAKGPRLFITYAPVQTDKTGESMREIGLELRAFLGDRPPTAEELAKVKRAQTLSLPGRWETASAVLGDIAEIVTYDLPDDYWDIYPERVRNLTVEQIADAAGEVIAPGNLLWVVVGDREKIEAEIRDLGFGDITLLDADGNVLEAASALR
jgi:zinc protease